MATATQPVPSVQYSLNNPPPGSKFEYDEVKTDRGKTSLGQVPLLTWGDTDEDIQNAIAFYGAEGISNSLNGTSLRVSFQGIARTAKEKAAADPAKASAATDEAIAQKQLEFRPGKREGGTSTPASRAASAARKAANVASAEGLAKLLEMVQNKTLDPSLLAAAGFDPETFYSPTVQNGEDEEPQS